MEFYHTKQDGKLVMPEIQRQMREHYINCLKEGSHVKEVLTKISPNKTHQQVKTFWAMIIAMTLAEFEDRGWDTSIILNLPEPTGVPISSGLLKEYLYAQCPIYDDDGNRITLSNEKMSIEKASEQFESMRNHLATQFSIYIPEPDKNWRNKK